MSRQRRLGIWLAVLGAIAGASIGYALEGLGLAIVEALAFVFAGVVAFRYVPEVLPPPPGSVVRPPVAALSSSPAISAVGAITSILALAALAVWAYRLRR